VAVLALGDFFDQILPVRHLIQFGGAGQQGGSAQKSKQFKHRNMVAER
jgi:hypothetical protein